MFPATTSPVLTPMPMASSGNPSTRFTAKLQAVGCLQQVADQLVRKVSTEGLANEFVSQFEFVDQFLNLPQVFGFQIVKSLLFQASPNPGPEQDRVEGLGQVVFGA